MGLGIHEIAVVGVLVILIFGGKKFAELGKGLGEGIMGFKRAVRDTPAPEPEAEKREP